MIEASELGAFTLTDGVLNRDYINPTDSRPIYRPMKCQILALFSSADKNKIITTLLYFFPSADSFWVLAIGRGSADNSADFILE